MKIAPGVSWHPFDDRVYVHNSQTQRDYILEGIATDVLSFFSKHGNAELDMLFDKLSAEYEVDPDELWNDIREFLTEMTNEEILYEDTTPHVEKPWSNKIPMEVARHYAKKHKLFSIGLELTWRCVERCIHCYIDDAPKHCSTNELTLDEYKSILKQARELGCVNLLLTGGEVLLRPDICDIVEYATKLGFIVNIYTTGLGLTDEIFDRLCTAKVNGISVSLYSGDPKVHDAITGVKGSFEKTLKAALMFKAAGINTFIKCVAMKQNIDSLESLYKLGRRLNLYVTVSPRVVSGHAGKRASDYSLGSLELYKKFYALQAKYVPRDETAKKFSREEMLDGEACGAGRNSFSIDPFGGVHACLTFNETFGSVRKDSLETLWDRAKHLDFKNCMMRRVMPKCESCDYIENCSVCVADLINTHGGEISDCGETLLMARAIAEIDP